jgi:PTS system nitrogen regulatory IIA component
VETFDLQGASDESIASLLNLNLIRIHLPQRDKNALMTQLVNDLCSVKSFANRQNLLHVMVQREKEGVATTLDTGLSLPHARIDGLAEPAAILGVPARPIADPLQPNLPIRAMFLFFTPNQTEAYGRQLRLLRSIAKLFRREFLDRLVGADSSEEILNMIVQQETSLRKS